MNPITVNQRVTNAAAAAHHEVECTCWKGGLARDDLGQCPGTGRYQVGGFENNRVTKSESRGNFPNRRRHREVPWADDYNNAHGFAPGLDFDAWPHRFCTVVDLAVYLGCKIMEKLP